MQSSCPGIKSILNIYDAVDKNPGISKVRISERGVSLSTVTKALDVLIDAGIVTAQNAGVKTDPITYRAVNIPTVHVADVSDSCFSYASVTRGDPPKIIYKHYCSGFLPFCDNLREFVTRVEFDRDFLLILPHGLSRADRSAAIGYFPHPPVFVTDRNSAAENGILYGAGTDPGKLNMYLRLGSHPFVAASGMDCHKELLASADPGLILCGDLKSVREVCASPRSHDELLRAAATAVNALTAFFRPDTLTVCSEDAQFSDADVRRIRSLSSAGLPPDLPNRENPLPTLIAAGCDPKLIGAAGLYRYARLAEYFAGTPRFSRQ